MLEFQPTAAEDMTGKRIEKRKKRRSRRRKRRRRRRRRKAGRRGIARRRKGRGVGREKKMEETRKRTGRRRKRRREEDDDDEEEDAEEEEEDKNNKRRSSSSSNNSNNNDDDNAGDNNDDIDENNDNNNNNDNDDDDTTTSTTTTTTPTKYPYEETLWPLQAEDSQRMCPPAVLMQTPSDLSWDPASRQVTAATTTTTSRATTPKYQYEGSLLLVQAEASQRMCLPAVLIKTPSDLPWDPASRQVTAATSPLRCRQSRFAEGAKETGFACWLIACLTSQQHARVSLARIC